MTNYRPAQRRLDEPHRCLLPNGTRKSSYRSPAKARQAIRQHRNRTVRLYVYRCPDCGFWHITSQPQPDANGGAS